MTGPGLVWLCLDTAAPQAAVAVLRAGVVVGGATLDAPRRHAENLASAIARALAQASAAPGDVEGVVVGVGPGSFVGVRVAMATAKGWAIARRVPLVGVCSLHAVACSAGDLAGCGAAVLDAKRGELYVRAMVWSAGAAPLADGDPQVLPPAAVKGAVGPCEHLVGVGLEHLDGRLTDAARHPSPGPSAEGLGAAAAMAIAARDPARSGIDQVPRYLRAPSAKRPPPRTVAPRDVV